jgi:hypothetical protein
MWPSLIFRNVHDISLPALFFAEPLVVPSYILAFVTTHRIHFYMQPTVNFIRHL